MRGDRKHNAALLDIAVREQQRLAEDLHDTLCQNLVGISLLVKLMLRRVEAGKKVSGSEIAKINAYVEEAIEHARAPLRAQFVSQTERGLVKALQDLARLGGRKLKCRLEIPPGVMIHDPSVAQVFYRIAEDAVREATRRTHAKEMSISLSQQEGNVYLEVLSDGASLPSAQGDRDDDLLRRFADAAGIELTLERKSGCVYRAVAPNAAKD